MLIKDRNANVFGAFVCEHWQNCVEYYGSRGTFVFKENTGAGLQVWTSSADKCKCYKSSNNFISVGIAHREAIYLNRNFAHGTTSFCPTFGSPPLIGNKKDTVKFDIAFLEIWSPAYDC